MVDFNIASFLENLVFFQAVFCTEQLYITCRIDCDRLFLIFMFDSQLNIV